MTHTSYPYTCHINSKLPESVDHGILFCCNSLIQLSFFHFHGYIIQWQEEKKCDKEYVADIRVRKTYFNKQQYLTR